MKYLNRFVRDTLSHHGHCCAHSSRRFSLVRGRGISTTPSNPFPARMYICTTLIYRSTTKQIHSPPLLRTQRLIKSYIIIMCPAQRCTPCQGHDAKNVLDVKNSKTTWQAESGLKKAVLELQVSDKRKEEKRETCYTLAKNKYRRTLYPSTHT